MSALNYLVLTIYTSIESDIRSTNKMGYFADIRRLMPNDYVQLRQTQWDVYGKKKIKKHD